MNQVNIPQQLAERAQSGDAEAIGSLLEMCVQPMYVVAYGLLNDKEKAITACKEAAAAAWKNITSMNPMENIENWLYRLTYSVCDHMLNPADRPARVADTEQFTPHPNDDERLLFPQVYATRGELKKRLIHIVFSLPDVLRETVVLTYYHEKSIIEIAGIMGSSKERAQSRLSLAHEMIKTSLQKQEKQNDENIFGSQEGTVSLNAFLNYHINANLPSPNETADILDAPHNAADFAAAHPAEPAAPDPAPAAVPRHRTRTSAPAITQEKSEKPASSGSRKLVKGLFIAAAICAVFACGFFVARYLIPNDSSDAPAAAAPTQSVSSAASSNPAAAPASPLPTQTKTITAYEAYLDVLEENEEAIKDYDWQIENSESRPVTFADIMGDETPELIYVSLSDGDDPYLILRVMTFDGEKAVEACRFDLEDYFSEESGDYCLTLIEDEDDDASSLYLFSVSGSEKESNTFSVSRFETNGEYSLKKTEIASFSPQFGEGRSSEGVYTSKEAETYYTLAKESSAVLMTTSDDFISRHLRIDLENEAKTYDEAVSFLNGKTTDKTESDEDADSSEETEVVENNKIFSPTP